MQKKKKILILVLINLISLGVIVFSILYFTNIKSSPIVNRLLNKKTEKSNKQVAKESPIGKIVPEKKLSKWEDIPTTQAVPESDEIIEQESNEKDNVDENMLTSPISKKLYFIEDPNIPYEPLKEHKDYNNLPKFVFGTIEGLDSNNSIKTNSEDLEKRLENARWRLEVDWEDARIVETQDGKQIKPDKVVIWEDINSMLNLSINNSLIFNPNPEENEYFNLIGSVVYDAIKDRQEKDS